MLRLGVIGTGHLGSIHAKLWKDQQRVELVGIYDSNASMAERKAQELGVRSFGSVEECVQFCDAVTIAVPTSAHFEVAVQCIAAGRHCLIEKPITHTYDEALELIRLADAARVMIQVGHVERFNPAFVAARQYDLHPLFIEAHRLSQFRPRATDVSVIHDLMIHDIDIVLWLVQSPAVRIDANGVSVITDTVDIANARIEFENGAVANLTASRISASAMRKMRIFQKSMYVSLDFAKPSVDVYRISDMDDKSVSAVPAVMLGQIEAGMKNMNIVFEQPTVQSTNAIAEEQRTFIESILDGAPISVLARDAAEALRIAATIEEKVQERLGAQRDR